MDLRLLSAASETKAFLMIYDKPFFYWKTLETVIYSDYKTSSI
jgi:hypothetical protein